MTNVYYIKDTILPIDEDVNYEFKAHRNFSSDEVPAWRPDGTKICPSRAMAEYYKLKNANRTRQPISRNICGFLNSGKGGTVMIGVLDSGKVVGICLSSLQKDHLLLSVEDAMRRFKPRIPYEFIKVCFNPVLDDKLDLQYLDQPKLCEPPPEMKRQPHHLRTTSLCWCDHHAMNRFKLGFVSMYYVVEVHVAPLHPELRTPEVAKALAKLMKEELSPLVRLSWPAFTSEDNNLFVRVLNCLVKYTEEDITKFNNYQTKKFVENELRNMESMSSEGGYNVDRHKHLQSLMPDGVMVSKAYLQSILNHTEPVMFNPPPVPIPVNDEDDEPLTKSSQIDKADESQAKQNSLVNTGDKCGQSKKETKAKKKIDDISSSEDSDTDSSDSSGTSSDKDDSELENVTTKFVDDLLVF